MGLFKIPSILDLRSKGVIETTRPSTARPVPPVPARPDDTAPSRELGVLKLRIPSEGQYWVKLHIPGREGQTYLPLQPGMFIATVFIDDENSYRNRSSNGTVHTSSVTKSQSVTSDYDIPFNATEALPPPNATGTVAEVGQPPSLRSALDKNGLSAGSQVLGSEQRYWRFPTRQNNGSNYAF